MKSAFYILGRTMQIVGMGTVLIAFVSFFSSPDMGGMMKTTLIGVVEFYAGNFLVSKTGEKAETGDAAANTDSKR